MTAKKAKKPKKPDIVHAMVGTAGHVSHGKSTLVECLTGCSMNRLPEEKARGLTIDLGFAACFLPGDRVIGIVDVPGHRDFIRNMAAGAASIDILMLIVAADDGVMPQTEEHMRIVRLLGVRRAMVVITKTDLVDAEMIDLVKEDVAGLMARSGFTDASIVCFSSKTIEGLDDVRETLLALIDEVGERPKLSGAFRMNVERAFSVKGYGTVVTGIPVSGMLAVGDEAELLPSGVPTTVRAVQTYKYRADAAVEGACAAINVRDIPVEAVSRGMTLAERGVFGATSSLLATVTNARESVTLNRISEIKFHCGTSGVNASLRLIAAHTLGPGEEAFAEVRTSEPVVVAAGDRFILRTHSPSNTVAGGTVLSARAEKLKGSSPVLLRRLRLAREAVRAGDGLASALLAGPSAAVETGELLRLTRAKGEDARKVVAEREKKGDIVPLGGDGWLVRERLDEVVAAVKGALARYHKENRYALGMRAEQAARGLGLGEKCARSLTEAVARADPEMTVKHGRLALASFSPALSARQAELRDEIVRRVAAGGANALARGNLRTELGASEADMKLLVRLLAEEGTVTVLGNWLMHTPAFEGCRSELLALFEKAPNVEMSPFRKATGVSRNLAVAILEQFDSEGLTRRSGKGRILVRRAAGN